MRSIKLLFVIVSLLFLEGCKKDPKSPPTLLEQMPERTEIGAEDMFAIIDNNYIFSTQTSGGLFTPSMYSWYQDANGYFGQLYMSGYYYYRSDNFDLHEEILTVDLRHVYEIGSYELNSVNTSLFRGGYITFLILRNAVL